MSRFSSSAKWCMELNLTSLYRLLIKKLKRKRPRTDSWGTRYLIGLFLDLLPSTLVNCFMSSYKNWNHLLQTLILEGVSFLKRIVWLTVSNAFLISRNTPQTNWPVSQACLIFLVISNRAEVLKWLLLNPNYFS